MEVPNRLPKVERRRRLKKLIEEVGLWNINKTKLAKEWGISRTMIKKDIKAIMRAVPKQELEEIQFAIHVAFKKSLNEAHKILFSSESNSEKLKAIQAIAQVSKEYTNMLESYGLKKKVPELVESINVGLDTKDLRELYLKWKNQNK